ncbi:hypothetical protein CAPTEDRAFT_191399 [Capitella teleta]|uniref:Uncharacterized protein n=1 Tax=Capitella teleta TaxID=283909 RepID=R7T345_CAPTE|nr:hypothetical protein CAPTEDRAFT_191399 [Capitella teleta]|eukprot:ELT87003.1 hypothetical protein CAPTEDRAFT_191399 [Capitella teleta]
MALEQNIVQARQLINGRGFVTDESAKVDPCNGADTVCVKAFLRNLELVPDQHKSVMKRMARAPLLRESLQWLQTLAFTYNTYRNFILRTFLSQDTDGLWPGAFNYTQQSCGLEMKFLLANQHQLIAFRAKNTLPGCKRKEIMHSEYRGWARADRKKDKENDRWIGPYTILPVIERNIMYKLKNIDRYLKQAVNPVKIKLYQS